MESNEQTDLRALVEEVAALELHAFTNGYWGATDGMRGLASDLQAGIRAQQERIERLEAVARAADAYLYSYEGTDELEAALRVWKGEKDG